MNKTRAVLAVLTLTVLVPVLSGRGDKDKGIRIRPKDREKVSALMHRKLEHSQKVLEGIALADFDEIAKHADELILLSKKAEWTVLKTPKYEVYSSEFRRAAEDLIKNAKDKNIEAATLSYMDMTMDCVRCHKYVREIREARRD
ncbi:MAG TPA: hypothetical protein VG013_15410 [Gemmataceae bacterium]|jgi:hypothetical protein|nr:hypothetical protein [Gemmataceae bacterium]